MQHNIRAHGFKSVSRLVDDMTTGLTSHLTAWPQYLWMHTDTAYYTELSKQPKKQCDALL